MNVEKKGTTLRTRLSVSMALLVLLQSLALFVALLFSRVYQMLDAEAFRLFTSAAANRAQSYNANVGLLIASMQGQTALLTETIDGIAAEAGIDPNEIYLDSAAYTETALQSTEHLLDLLGGNQISGAFFMLNGSNTDTADTAAHSGVYLRNSAPGVAKGDWSNYLLEIGPTAVAQQYHIATSINWDLHLEADIDTRQGDFYTRPVWAATQEPNAEIERYGYWAPPVDVLDDGGQVVLYTMPLLDGKGAPYGVLGVEISLSLLEQVYLPDTDLPFHNSFYAIALMQQGNVSLDWYIPSGPLSQVYLRQATDVSLQPVRGDNLTDVYIAQLEGLGEVYCSVHELVIYSRNSPFYEASWCLLSVVPKQVLHETSQGVRLVLNLSILLTTAISFAAAFFLIYILTRKISGLSKYVAALSPQDEIHFTRTGLREIDDLMRAVEMLNRRVITAGQTTSKLLALTLLPMGGFEVSSDNMYVELTEYVRALLYIPMETNVTREQWDAYYAELTAHPAEEDADIYQYSDPVNGSKKWLRILVTGTDTGAVGMVLDVSRDVEERRRLTHELDYDALTRLYNRVAFKREAHRMIQEKPDAIGAMIFADLDNLKYINDSFGHDVGDRLIMRAGEMFAEFRQHGGVVSRISGDEFAVYLHGFESKAVAWELIDRQFAENAHFGLETPDGRVQKIRCSSGLAWYPEDSDNVTDLLKLSDYAMYEAKHNRKGSLNEFNESSYQENAFLLENRELINHLLDEGLIRFAFQPIYDLHTGEIFAYEALMRPTVENFRSPLEILRVAAAQFKLNELERLVILKAFAYLDAHEAELGKAMLFMNSIPSQMMPEEDHKKLWNQYAHLFKRVVVEITEEENRSPHALAEKIAVIRDMGIKIAVDDFGSGYSNEVRILSMNPDILKIDMELISEIDKSPDKQQLVTNLVAFCHPKGIALVAEGVERREELAEVIYLGVDYVQGYYTGRPEFGFSPVNEVVKQEILELGG